MNGMHFTTKLLFILYLVFINLCGVIVMGADKRKSQKGRYRTPERSMFTIAFLGGALGIYTGMRLFHHKTLHKKFVYGIPLILIINLIAVFFLFKTV